MSTTPDPTPIDRTGRDYDLVHADYFHGTVDELIPGDGFRLLAVGGRTIPADWCGPLVVTHVSHDPAIGLVGIEFCDRGSMVSNVLDEALYDLPAAATPMVAGAVFAPGERVLIRG